MIVYAIVRARRPPNSTARRIGRLLLCGLIIVAGSSSLAMAPPTRSGAIGERSEPIRLRISWGGGPPARWLGQVALDRGTLSDLRNAALNADAAGSVWLEEGHLTIRSLSAHGLDAVEISANSGSESLLLVELSADSSSPPLRAQIPLSDLGRGPHTVKLDDRGNTLNVQAVATSALRISVSREPLIFAPGERFTFELRPMLDEAAPGTTLDVHTTLSAVHGNETMWSDHQTVAVPVEGDPVLALNVPMPRTEGVYRIRVVATQPPGFRDRFLPGGSPPLAERTFTAVVLDSDAPASVQPAQWEEVLKIDPTNPRWDRLPAWTQLRLIPGLKRGALGSTRAGSIENAFGRFVELPPAAPGSEPHWQAYSLPVEAAGVPHLLEIDYPSVEEQQFSVSIVEPDSSGVAEGVAWASGVFVEGLGRSEAKTHRTQQTVFWPRTQAPLLLVTNQHPTAPAHFGQIRVLKYSANRLASISRRNPSGERLVAAYVAGPSLADALGIEQTPSNARRADNLFPSADWSRLYPSATRLADYLNYAGYNGAVLRLPSEGTSLLPVTANTSRPPDDAVRLRVPDSIGGLPDPDYLELLLRVFDREQLTLVPALQLAVPLPELEALRRRSDPQSAGLEWVGPDGRTWLETYGTRSGLAPYYNLLNPRVQEALLQSLSELLDQYGQHASLGGVAIELSGDGYAQLPTLEWGLDDDTTSRFESDSGNALDATGPTRFAARNALLNGVNNTPGQYTAAWREWRANQVADFYGRMATLIRANNDRRRLVLTTERAFERPEIMSRILPNILSNRPLATAVLLDMGIDYQKLQGIPGLVVCPTQYIAPSVPLQNRAIELELNQAFTAERRSAGSAVAPAALLYHRSQSVALTSFAAKSPIQVAADFHLSYQPLAHWAATRQPYALTLADNDCAVLLDGGERLPLGEEDTLREVRQLMQRLPTAAHIEELRRQPVLVRTYNEQNSATVLVVNTCPWTTETRIQFAVSKAVSIVPLTDASSAGAASSAASAQLVPGGPPWSLTLEPYAVKAAQVAASGVKVTAVEAHVSDAAQTELAARLADLNDRDTNPRLYKSLENPSFEPAGPGTNPGWRLLANPGVAIAQFEPADPHQGKSCLLVRSKGPLAVVESNSFPTPPTGQFALTVWLRGRNLASDAELRLALEVDRGGPIYRSFRALRGQGAADGYQITEGWQPYPILVNNLPLDSQGQMRVRFELSGAGEICLDQIETYDLLFPLRFYRDKDLEWIVFQKLILAAKDAYSQAQFTDCARYLDGYWPRFLAAYTPRNPPRIANQPPPASGPQTSPPAAQPAQKESPGFSERWKRLLWFR